jgi:predicted regulator of Ras-like GTPase activity (Roadblock/LC7/MglB family)
MALVGNLRDLKLPNLIQLNCMERNSAKLTIESAGKYGIIYFYEGQIVHAEFDPDIGEKALFRMLGLPEGKFKVENGVRAPMSTITTHWNNLLLEGLHQLDTLHASDEGKEQRLLEMFMNVKGVKRAAIISKEGESKKSEFQDEKEFALKALLFHQAQNISGLLRKEKPEFVTMVGQSKRIILTEYEENVVYLDIDAKYQLETVLPFIKQVLG